MPEASKPKPAKKSQQTAPYKHLEAKSLMRPEVGTQAQFKKKKPPKTYRYDSSLSPALDWDAKNVGEVLARLCNLTSTNYEILDWRNRQQMV